MRYPLVLCSHNRLVIANALWFDSIGHLDPIQRRLSINVGALGPKGLTWFIDANGCLFRLIWQGMGSSGILELLRLKRKVENYMIEEPESITVGQLRTLIANSKEQFEEAPNSADLRTALKPLAETTVVDRQFMFTYLGE